MSNPLPPVGSGARAAPGGRGQDSHDELRQQIADLTQMMQARAAPAGRRQAEPKKSSGGGGIGQH